MSTMLTKSIDHVYSVPMESTAHRLATRVSSIDPEELSQVEKNIEGLDAENSRFSEMALQLLAMPEERGVTSARSRLRNLGSHSDLSYAKMQAYKAYQRSRQTSDTATYVLSASYISYAVASIGFINRELTGAMQHAVRQNDGLIEAKHPDLKPATFGSVEENIRYYQSLATAAYILDIHPTEESVIDASAVFVEWAMKQEHISSAIQASYTSKSLNPATLETLVALINATPQPLHGGLI